MQTLRKFTADFFFQGLEAIVRMKDLVRSARQWFQGMFMGQSIPVCMFSNVNYIAKKGYFNGTLCCPKIYYSRSQHRHVFHDWASPFPPHFGG